MNDHKNPIVIELGSGNISAGFAGDNSPKRIIPTIVGYTKQGQKKILCRA